MVRVCDFAFLEDYLVFELFDPHRNICVCSSEVYRIFIRTAYKSLVLYPIFFIFRHLHSFNTKRIDFGGDFINHKSTDTRVGHLGRHLTTKQAATASLYHQFNN